MDDTVVTFQSHKKRKKLIDVHNNQWNKNEKNGCIIIENYTKFNEAWHMKPGKAPSCRWLLRSTCQSKNASANVSFRNWYKSVKGILGRRRKKMGTGEWAPKNKKRPSGQRGFIGINLTQGFNSPIIRCPVCNQYNVSFGDFKIFCFL